jgi:hypothetical protein
VNLGTRFQWQSPYQSTLKYLNHKKDANPNAHVNVFHIAVRTNGETSKEYTINAFNYTLKETASNWCQNYMSKFPNYSFYELMQVFCKHHCKMHNDEHIYMELKNIKQGKFE